MSQILSRVNSFAVFYVTSVAVQCW